MNLQIGSTIGDYQVVGILGAGGMGQVYKVRNVISDRVEAMKVLLPDLATEADLANRFLREIKLQASLEHPNIAALHTAIRVDNQLLMLMEFVEGVTLEQRLREGGPLSPPEAVYYISQALSALEYAHAHGVIHRDIKPANMIVTPEGVLKVMDFGIAKGAADHKLTQTGATLGSLYYMAPEQIQGSANLDGRADLYSVGVTLYELVTGKRPFDGDSQFAIMAAHMEKTPVPPITVDPRLPQALNDVILLAVAKDPGARFQSAGAFRNALANIVPAAQAAAAVPGAKPARAAGGSKRGLWMAIGALAAVLAVVAAIQFGPWRASKAAPPPGASSAAPILTQAPAAPTEPVAQPPASEPVAQPPLQQPAQASAQPFNPPVPAKQVSKSPGAAAARPQPAASAPPAQPAAVSAPQAPLPVQQSQPPPVQQAPVQAAAPPVVTGPSRQEIRAARDQLTKLNSRAQADQSSLKSFGPGLRADMRQAANLLDSYLQDATDAFNAGDLAEARSYMDKAQRQIDVLDKFLGR
jgi:serine/threonine-protein kinase